MVSFLEDPTEWLRQHDAAGEARALLGSTLDRLLEAEPYVQAVALIGIGRAASGELARLYLASSEPIANIPLLKLWRAAKRIDSAGGAWFALQFVEAGEGGAIADIRNILAGSITAKQAYEMLFDDWYDDIVSAPVTVLTPLLGRSEGLLYTWVRRHRKLTRAEANKFCDSFGWTHFSVGSFLVDDNITPLPKPIPPINPHPIADDFWSIQWPTGPIKLPI